MASLVHSLSLAHGTWASESLRRWWSLGEFNPMANASESVLEQLKTTAQARSASFSMDQRMRLIDALRRQYKLSGLEIPHATCTLLESPRTMVVTTAHQPNWLGGPAYWLHKLLSTIALAEHLAKILPDFQWVPLYWMGSEDHDLAELGHCVVNGKRLDWEGDKGTFAFGRLMVPDSVSTDWFDAFENAPYCEEVLSLLQNAYARGFTVAQSTRRLAHALLGDGGWLERGVGAVGNSLLVLDGDDAMLKEAFAPVWRDQIQSPGLAASLVEQRKEQMLANHGIAVDLHVRDWPFFVLDGKARIKPEGRWNADDLLGMPPVVFSPGVALRPLYQEFSIPNVAFVGGGSEQLYWAALKPLFAHYEIPFPLTLLRPSLTWLAPEISQQWTASGWAWDDLGKSAEELESKFWSLIVQKHSSASPFWNEGDFGNWAEHQVESLIHPLRALLLDMDSGLLGAVGASRHKMIQELERLEQLYRKALRRKFKGEHEAAQKVIRNLTPSGIPMERVEGMWSTLAYGGPAVLQTYKDALNPMDADATSKAPWLRFIDLRA